MGYESQNYFILLQQMYIGMHVQMQGVPTSITLIIDYIMYSRRLYTSTNFSVAIHTQFTYIYVDFMDPCTARPIAWRSVPHCTH